jgi:hypothetical protein
MTPLRSDGLHYADRQGRSPWAGWSVVAASRSRGKLPSGAFSNLGRIAVGTIQLRPTLLSTNPAPQTSDDFWIAEEP